MKKGIVTILLGSIAVWAQAADIKAGEEKAMVCVACHGPGGVSANPDWPSLAGQGQKYIEKQLKDFKSGERPNMVMQPQAGLLSDEDIVNVAAYFAAQTPPPATTEGAGDNPEELLAVGEALYRGGDMSKNVPACMACHGPTGAGIEPAAFPRISGQHAKYTRTQLDAFRTAAMIDEQASETDRATLVVRGNDPNGMMRDVAEKLTPKQI
ncbi:MAG: cytochrome c4, partial [Cardiobacterium sp.]